MGNTGDMYNDLSCIVEEYGEVPVSVGGTTVHLIQITVAARYKGAEITRITTLIGSQNRN